MVNQKPILAKGETQGKEQPKQRAQRERIRRDEERGYLEELSRYYPRASGVWTRPTLLTEGKHRHVQRTEGIPLTDFFISGAGPGDSSRSPMDPERVGAWSVNVDHDGFVVSPGYPNG